MSDPLLDILKKHDELGDEELLNYLMGHLTPDERREVEERIAASDMNSDAEEGLRSMESKEKIATITAALNQQLAAQLRNKRRQKKRFIPNQTLLLLATLLVLLLVVLAFAVIYKMKQG